MYFGERTMGPIVCTTSVSKFWAKNWFKLDLKLSEHFLELRCMKRRLCYFLLDTWFLLVSEVQAIWKSTHWRLLASTNKTNAKPAAPRVNKAEAASQWAQMPLGSLWRHAWSECKITCDGCCFCLLFMGLMSWHKQIPHDLCCLWISYLCSCL